MSIIKNIEKEYNPAKLVNYLFELTKNFSSFYHSNSILEAETKDLMNTRLLLVEQVKMVIIGGLSLLGIKTVEEV